jgi:hypothetical protein
MNTETIKDFIRKNLEVTYYEIAEEMMLLNPMCELLDKWDKKNNQVDINKENFLLKISNKNLNAKIRSLKNEPVIRYNKKDEDLEEAKEIKRIVDAYFMINTFSKTRNRKITYPRHIAIYYIRKKTKMTFRKIASFFGHKNHVSAFNAIKSISNLKRYIDVKNHISDLDKIFNVDDTKRD